MGTWEILDVIANCVKFAGLMVAIGLVLFTPDEEGRPAKTPKKFL